MCLTKNRLDRQPLQTHLELQPGICKYVYIYMYVYVYMYIYLYLCIYVNMYKLFNKCIYVNMYICIYIYGFIAPLQIHAY